MPDGADAYPAYEQSEDLSPDGAGAYPAYEQSENLSPDGANAYPAYEQSENLLPDGAGAYPAYELRAALNRRPDKTFYVAIRHDDSLFFLVDIRSTMNFIIGLPGGQYDHISPFFIGLFKQILFCLHS